MGPQRYCPCPHSLASHPQPGSWSEVSWEGGLALGLLAGRLGWQRELTLQCRLSQPPPCCRAQWAVIQLSGKAQKTRPAPRHCVEQPLHASRHGSRAGGRGQGKQEMEGQSSCQPDRQAHLFQAGQSFSLLPSGSPYPLHRQGPGIGTKGTCGKVDTAGTW